MTRNDKQTKRTARPCDLRHAAAVLAVLLVLPAAAAPPAGRDAAAPEAGADTPRGPRLRIARLVQTEALARQYPYALPSLLTEANRRTTINVDEQPVLISSFEDPELFSYPLIFVNFADRPDWTLSDTEQRRLRDYLERGGFLFIDAGINAEFLRADVRYGQHHSFGEWDACPEIKAAFKAVFPDKTFRPLRRSHELFKSFYTGLPDPGSLPDTVRDFVVNEKWPDGTYSAVALHVEDRIAVLATPIISMGWGKTPFGTWATTISFRVREGAEGLSERLETAAYSGERFQTTREDGRKDVIYCQRQALPAWVEEPDGRWRVFQYYQSREISEYAHVFYTRLGINILVYALTQ
jgi:hypothetical protein